MRRLWLVAIVLPLLCGCALTGAMVGEIAGQVVNVAIERAKADTQKQIADAVERASEVINANVNDAQATADAANAKADAAPGAAQQGGIAVILLAIIEAIKAMATKKKAA